jgi:hypothetical protein
MLLLLLTNPASTIEISLFDDDGAEQEESTTNGITVTLQKQRMRILQQDPSIIPANSIACFFYDRDLVLLSYYDTYMRVTCTYLCKGTVSLRM